MKLRNALVLITGASGGIGAATAREMGAAGARVVLLARTESKLAVVAEELRRVGAEAFVYPCDLSDANAVSATGFDAASTTRFAPSFGALASA